MTHRSGYNFRCGPAARVCALLVLTMTPNAIGGDPDRPLSSEERFDRRSRFLQSIPSFYVGLSQQLSLDDPHVSGLLLEEVLDPWRNKVEHLREFEGDLREQDLAWSPLDRHLLRVLRRVWAEGPLFRRDGDRQERSAAWKRFVVLKAEGPAEETGAGTTDPPRDRPEPVPGKLGRPAADAPALPAGYEPLADLEVGKLLRDIRAAADRVAAERLTPAYRRPRELHDRSLTLLQQIAARLSATARVSGAKAANRKGRSAFGQVGLILHGWRRDGLFDQWAAPDREATAKNISAPAGSDPLAEAIAAYLRVAVAKHPMFEDLGTHLPGEEVSRLAEDQDSLLDEASQQALWKALWTADGYAGEPPAEREALKKPARSPRHPQFRGEQP